PEDSASRDAQAALRAAAARRAGAARDPSAARQLGLGAARHGARLETRDAASPRLVRAHLSAALTCAALLAAACGAPADSASGARQPAQVRKVVDGDTIEVERAGRIERVRLIGIDAPEAHDSPKLDRLVARGLDRSQILALGREATAFTRARLLGHRV